MAEIFISYSRDDLDRARTLAQALEREGWEVWWDRRILPGQRFDQVIRDAMDQADCVVVLWSASSVESDWVREEAEQAKIRDCLLPVVIDEVAPPLGFGRIQTGNLVGWAGERDHPGYASLLLALANFAGGEGTTTSLTAPATSAGEDSGLGTVGRYHVVRALGSGSFATVWLAHDPDLDADVAVKVLAENWSLDQDIKRRFIDEARILRRLEHPSITRVYDIGEDEGRPFFVMEYADRGSLLERMQERRETRQPFGVEEAIGVSASIAEALEVAHTKGVVHRDLKPSNVLFRSDERSGTAERAMLADFGIARNLQAASGYTISAGTPHYAAPEQAEGRADERSDIHAAGAVLYELLGGEVPYPYPSLGQVLKAQQTTGPPSLMAIRSDVPTELDNLIREAMAVDPNQRVPTARAWRTRLSAIHPAAAPSSSPLPSTVAFTPSGSPPGHGVEDRTRAVPRPESTPATAEVGRAPSSSLEGPPVRTDPAVAASPGGQRAAPLTEGTSEQTTGRNRWWVAGTAAAAVAAAVVVGAVFLGAGDADRTSATSTIGDGAAMTSRGTAGAVTTIPPRDPGAQEAFTQGEFYLDARAYEKAVAQYDEALFIEPSVAEYERQWGIATFRWAWEDSFESGYWVGGDEEIASRFSAAAASFRRVTELDPEDQTALLYLARVGFDLNWNTADRGAFADIVLLANDVIELDPGDWGGHQVKALALLELELWDETISAMSTAIELGETDPSFLAGVWGGVETGNWHDVAEMYMVGGRAQMGRGDLAAAIELFGDCLGYYAADHQCLFHRGEAHEELGYMYSAAADYRSFLDSPESAGWDSAIAHATDFLADR